MSTHDRTWADVENQLRANFGTEEGEQDGVASRKIEKRSTMTFEGRRRSCLSLLRAFSAKIFAGRHARHLWNVLWHEKMLGEAWKSHVFILARNFEEFVDVISGREISFFVMVWIELSFFLFSFFSLIGGKVEFLLLIWNGLFHSFEEWKWNFFENFFHYFRTTFEGLVKKNTIFEHFARKYFFFLKD